jgi:hypothetical protein
LFIRHWPIAYRFSRCADALREQVYSVLVDSTSGFHLSQNLGSTMMPTRGSLCLPAAGTISAPSRTV